MSPNTFSWGQCWSFTVLSCLWGVSDGTSSCWWPDSPCCVWAGSRSSTEVTRIKWWVQGKVLTADAQGSVIPGKRWSKIQLCLGKSVCPSPSSPGEQRGRRRPADRMLIQHRQQDPMNFVKVTKEKIFCLPLCKVTSSKCSPACDRSPVLSSRWAQGTIQSTVAIWREPTTPARRRGSDTQWGHEDAQACLRHSRYRRFNVKQTHLDEAPTSGY